MRISSVRAVFPRWKKIATDAWQSHFWQIVVRVTTECGRIGYGYGGGGIPATQIINDHLSRFVNGHPLEGIEDIQSIWQSMYRASLPYGRGGLAMMAIGGVDLALWDLLGRASDQPVYELLGGLRNPDVKAYASGKSFSTYFEMGFSASKIPCKWSEPSDFERTEFVVSEAREVMGPSALLMLDCYMSWDSEVALEMRRRLESYNIYWFEDILTPDHKHELAVLRPSLAPVNSAAGEHEFMLTGFQALAECESLDIWQPDVTWCGGLTGALPILDLAEEHAIPVCLHRGGEVWGLHLIAASNCLCLAELVLPEAQSDQNQVWLGEPSVVDGRLRVNDRPGFGVYPNPEIVA